MKQYFEQISRYIDGQRASMLALWEELVNTESGSRQIEGVNAVCGILRRRWSARESIPASCRCRTQGIC